MEVSVANPQSVAPLAPNQVLDANASQPPGFVQRVMALPAQRKLMLGGGIAAIVAIFVAMMLWGRTGDYRVLYTNLSDKDGGAILAQLQQMQTLAAESRSLKSAPPVSPTQAGAALKAATARLGDQARVVVQGERATITLSGVNGEMLRSLLAQLRSTARARVVEAQFVRGGRGYDGTVVLSLGSAP